MALLFYIRLLSDETDILEHGRGRDIRVQSFNKGVDQLFCPVSASSLAARDILGRWWQLGQKYENVQNQL
jgi:hypothetical protein